MTKTIYTRIMTKEITSVELKSVLGREGQMFLMSLASLIPQSSSASILLTMKHGRNSTMSM